MRFIVYGAGAIGGVVGGRLAQSGHDVVLIARGAHLEAIREKGLVLESPLDRVLLQVPAAGSPAELSFGEGDAILLCMKTQDTLPALEELAALASPRTPIVCLQNGVESERLAARRFEHVYGSAVMLPASHLAAGVVQANSAPISGILDTGRYPEGVDDFCGHFTAALERSTFSARPEPRVMRRKYTKLLMNLGNAVQAAVGDGPEAAEWSRRAREEAVACYQAAGIEYASDEEDRERRGGLIRIAPIAGQRRGGGSSWQSLARGKRTIEADYLNGEIVLLGALHGVPTPVNRVLMRVATRLAREGALPGALSPADLERELAAQG